MKTQIEAIIGLSRAAETDTDWEKIDNKIQKLSKVNPDEAGKFVLQFAKDKDSRVRDTTASILTSLDLSNSTVSIVAPEMISQTVNDEDIFASGRAATFLLKHQENPELGNEINTALVKFQDKVIKNGWKDELISNIPNDSLNQLLIKSK